MQNLWHIAETPGGIHLHHLDPIALAQRADALRADDPDLSEDAAMAEAVGDAARAIQAWLGFAPRGRWLGRPGWRSSISPGDPHPKLLAAATVHDDLPALPPLPPLPALPRVRRAVGHADIR